MLLVRIEILTGTKDSSSLPYVIEGKLNCFFANPSDNIISMHRSLAVPWSGKKECQGGTGGHIRTAAAHFIRISQRDIVNTETLYARNDGQQIE
ncbi:hypothetical protein C400_21480 [Paenibacillus sp. ICGEB2008]|nr:hypothetical protein C400_21480 [Paenibacillus sp. ICGEB2008]